MPENLYYKSPSDKVFEELRQAVIDLRIELSPEFYKEKTDYLKSVTNVKDNFMHILATLDMRNQMTVFCRVSKTTQKQIVKRLNGNFYQPFFERLMQND